jgi:S1-C subfamily serine protease
MRFLSRVGLALIGVLLATTLLLAQPTEQPRGFLGVVIDPEQLEAKALVREVAPDSPAMKAGFKAGDVIKKVGGRDLKNGQDFFQAMAEHKPGEKIGFVVAREGKDQELSATLGERPARAEARPPDRRVPPQLPDLLSRARGAYLGIHMQAAEKGVQVVDVTPDTPAAKAGLKVDDIITGVGDKSAANPEELQRAIREAGVGKEVTLHVLRGAEKLDLKATLVEAPIGSRMQEVLPRLRERMPNIDMPPMLEGGRRVQELEKKIESLEKRIAELEKKLEKK